MLAMLYMSEIKLPTKCTLKIEGLCFNHGCKSNEIYSKKDVRQDGYAVQICVKSSITYKMHIKNRTTLLQLRL
jgi:hypothetical protein